MISEGAWITIATTVGGGFGLIIASIIKIPRKKNGSSAVVFDPKRCPAHSGLEANIKALNEGIERVEKNQGNTWDAIDEIRTDIKELLQR